MLFKTASRRARSVGASLVTLVAVASVSGCIGGGGGNLFNLFRTINPDAGGGMTSGGGGTVTGGGGGGVGGGGGRTERDPCEEPQSRKFVRLSLQNLVETEFIHYFLAMVAFVNSDAYPNGAACPDDIALYTSFGYQEIAEGQTRSFGNYCIEGPALLYYHENGEFRTGDSSLASSIAPSQGTTTFDQFFSSSGALVPVPDVLMFHNPGTGAGFNLKVAPTPPDACQVVVGGESNCGQDGFYYVDENDRPIGSTALGTGSYRRVPNEIQGTGCECGSSADGFAVLAPSGANASNALCNEFLRGGSISYAFIRSDVTPPAPQLIWRVTDGSGSVAHDYDTSAGVSP